MITAAVTASEESEVWVRERIQQARPRPDGMSETEYVAQVDSLMATDKITVLVKDIGEMLSGKSVTVAAFRRAMTVESGWRSVGIFPKRDMGLRQVKKVTPTKVTFLTEDGKESHLDLARAKVFQRHDVFFVSWPGAINVLRYEPAALGGVA